MSLNPWLALIIGILIGWLLEWLLERWFFRRQRLKCQARLTQVETDLAARDAELRAVRLQADALEADLTARATRPEVAAQVTTPDVKVEAPQVELPKVDLPTAGIGAGLGVAAGALAGHLPDVELPTTEAPQIELPSVEFPEVQLPTIEAPQIELPAIELPTVELPEAELPTIEAPQIELPAVELPEVELPKLDLPTAGIGTGLGVAAGALVGHLPDIDMPQVEVGAELPTADVQWQAVSGSVADVEVSGPRAVITPPRVEAELPDVPGASVTLPAGAVEALQPTAGVTTGAWAADDLTAIKGIGPKYAAQLSAAGITTFAALAAADPAHVRSVVNAPEWRGADYDAWIAGAKTLADKAPKRAAVVGDDLTLIEGIGAVYAGKLQAGGITTFAQLAAADNAALADLIQAPGWRKVNYADWREQSRLLIAGDQAGLEALQARLFARDRESANFNLIAGVGEKTAAALSAAGITTFAALAAATPERVAEITRSAGGRGGDYAAWIEEAKLRAAGKRVARVRKSRSVSKAVSCPQDLSRIKGIGRAYEEKLYHAGFGTFWQIAQASDEDLARVLEIKEFQKVNLAQIKADALTLAEDTDTTGREWDGTAPDDFEPFDGIGEVYEGRLYDAGICTYQALAGASVERLAAICNAPAWRMPDYASWIAQAQAKLAEQK